MVELARSSAKNGVREENDGGGGARGDGAGEEARGRASQEGRGVHRGVQQGDGRVRDGCDGHEGGEREEDEGGGGRDQREDDAAGSGHEAGAVHDLAPASSPSERRREGAEREREGCSRR